MKMSNRRSFLKGLVGLIASVALAQNILAAECNLAIKRAQVIGTFDRWIFPVIATMPHCELIDQLVAVQPMTGPAGHVFYMDLVKHRRSWLDRLFGMRNDPLRSTITNRL